MLSQKHTEASKVNYRSGFFITTNVLPNFGNEIDQEAVYRRLKVFHTKPLPIKDSSVVGKNYHFKNFKSKKNLPPITVESVALSSIFTLYQVPKY